MRSERRDLLGSGDLLRTVVEGALAAVVVMDEKGAVRGWGPQAERAFGWAADEAIGNELASLIVPPEVRDRHRAGIARYLRTRQPRVLGRVVEMEAVVRDGHRIPVEISINPPVEHEGETLFIAFIRDISERRQSEARQAQLYEEATHANQALRDFSSLMVHELRGPLAVVVGYASMLADGSLVERPAEARLALAELHRHAQTAAELVDHLLLVARADAGALTLQPENLDVDQLLAQVVERCQARASLLDGSLTARCSSGLQPAVGDASWTSSILANLVNNALIHSGPKPRVQIEAAAREGTSIWVTDGGKGIPEEARTKVFDRFFRVGEDGAGRGSGLGLYLSRQLARLQGGDLVLEPSSTGRGARFRLDLPRAAPGPRTTVS